MRKRACIFVVAVIATLSAFSQVKYTGKIIEQNGQPVPFATVSVKDTKTLVLANADGTFSISAFKTDTLVFHAVNFLLFKMAAGSVTDLLVTLARTDATLPDVLVTTAFNVQRQQRIVPYSAQLLTPEIVNIIPQTNLNDALVGKVAGIQFRSQSGAKLNDQTYARVRGGLYLNGDAGMSFIVNGTYANPAAIDPATIETITVLKGANATALFGGLSNGAIVITTKKGTYGKSTMQVSQGLTVDKVGRLPEFQNIYAGGGSAELLQYTWQPGDPEEWKALDGKYYHDYTDDGSWGPKMEGQEYVPWYSWVPGTPYSLTTAKLVAQPDNIKDFWETGVTSNTNINFSKAGQGYNSFLSYTKQVIDGVVPNSKSDRNIVSASLGLDINKFISAGIDLTFNAQKVQGNFTDGFVNPTTGNFYNWNQRDLDMSKQRELRALITPPGTSATWNWYHNPDSYDSSDPMYFYKYNYWFNSYAFLDNESISERNNRLFGNTYIKLAINRDLYIKGTLRLENSSSFGSNTVNSLLGNNLELYQTNESYATRLNYELLASYTKSLFDDIKLDLIAGGTFFKSIDKGILLSTSGGLNVPDLYDISNSVDQPGTSDGLYKQKSNALFAGGDIEYKKWIAASWTIRQTWYSTLPETDNSLFTPSVGISFIPTELAGLKSDWLSYVKVYGSWGRSPLSLGAYQTNTSFNVNPSPWNGNFLMTAGDAIPDQHLKGGLLTSYEAGLDIRLFKSRLGISFDYYNETADGQPIQINVDAVSGITGKVVNAATVKRNGLEWVLDVTPVKNRNFSWKIAVPGAWFLSNEVTKIIEGQERFQPSGWRSGGDRNAIASAFQVLGKDWGQLIGGGYARNEAGIPLLDPDTGLYITGDANYNWGSVVPRFTGGFQSFFTYKNIFLNFSIDYQRGGKFYSISEYWGNYSGTLAPSAAMNDKGMNVRDPVDAGGGVPVTGVSSADGKTPVNMYVDAFNYFHQFRSTRIAEPYIHDLSFVKLRELSAGYNLPVNKWAFTKKILQAASIAFIARNPWLIYTAAKNFDPSEISRIYGEEGEQPPTRSFGFNLSVTF